MLSLIGRCRDGRGEKCSRDGVMRLLDPKGLVVPGCFMCRKHAEECVKEYAEKLGEHWTILDVRTDERIDIISKNPEPRANYWTEAEARDDIELPRCIHGKPRNVFCDKCES